MSAGAAAAATRRRGNEQAKPERKETWASAAEDKAEADGQDCPTFRKDCFQEAWVEEKENTPAPPGQKKIVRGGQSLQYKEKRFKEIHTDAPGPGAYFQVAPVGVEIQSKMKQPSKVPEVQKVASNLKLFRKTDAPSIPYRGQTFGYEESEDGTLVKHKPPEKDNTLGPAYYQEDPVTEHGNPIHQKINQSAPGIKSCG
uniref:Uncharacterized protein n=1 Tax=Sphaerodactylus townsendi TaxID=933632 RepID=A0ACB8E8W3_9SAUR